MVRGMNNEHHNDQTTYSILEWTCQGKAKRSFFKIIKKKQETNWNLGEAQYCL